MKDYISAEERITHPIMQLWSKKVAEEVFILALCSGLLVWFVWQVIVDITN